MSLAERALATIHRNALLRDGTRVLVALSGGADSVALLLLLRELEHQGKLYTITLAPDGVKVVEKGKRNGKELSWASIISGDAALNEDLKISVDATRSGM